MLMAVFQSMQTWRWLYGTCWCNKNNYAIHRMRSRIRFVWHHYRKLLVYKCPYKCAVRVWKVYFWFFSPWGEHKENTIWIHWDFSSQHCISNCRPGGTCGQGCASRIVAVRSSSFESDGSYSIGFIDGPPSSCTKIANKVQHYVLLSCCPCPIP